MWSPETYKDIQAQFMNISRYVPELHNIVTPSIAFLSQHPTPAHHSPPPSLSLCRAQGHPFKGSLHQATSVPWGAYTDRAAGIEVRDRRKSLWGFFLSDDESLWGFLWHPHFSLLWVWWQRPVFKLELKDFYFFVSSNFSMTRPKTGDAFFAASFCFRLYPAAAAVQLHQKHFLQEIKWKKC